MKADGGPRGPLVQDGETESNATQSDESRARHQPRPPSVSPGVSCRVSCHQMRIKETDLHKRSGSRFFGLTDPSGPEVSKLWPADHIQPRPLMHPPQLLAAVPRGSHYISDRAARRAWNIYRLAL